jgi:hypothetical protein
MQGIRDALSRMSGRDREIAQLVFYERMSAAETGRILGITRRDGALAARGDQEKARPDSGGGVMKRSMRIRSTTRAARDSGRDRGHP